MERHVLMQHWLQAAAIYREPRILGIIFLSFSSGIPFLLTLGTLHVWLSESGVTKTTIGLFVALTLPYSLKLLWAPLIDHVKIPYLSKRLGLRRSWMLLSQVALIFSLLALGSTDPMENIRWTAVCTFFVAWCAASQDIVIEAYRIEALEKHQAGPSAGAWVLGFRLGMWVSGGGALYIAALFDWSVVYTVMAGFVVVGIITTLLNPEPIRPHSPVSQTPVIPAPSSFLQSLTFRFKNAVGTPIKSLMKWRDWAVILPFILFYKVGDSVLNTMSNPFLLEIGFSKLEIAHIAKSFGMGAMMFGGVVGGLLIARFSIFRVLVLCAVLQIFSSVLYMLQAQAGHDIALLMITIGVENLACGMGATAFIAYIASLCRMPYTATHYALLSSFGSIARIGLSMLAGFLADQMSWASFYMLVSLACFPCLFLLLLFAQRFNLEQSEPVLSSPLGSPGAYGRQR